MNVPRREALSMPFGELGDMIACYQIVNGAEQKRETAVLGMIPDLD